VNHTNLTVECIFQDFEFGGDNRVLGGANIYYIGNFHQHTNLYEMKS